MLARHRSRASAPYRYSIFSIANVRFNLNYAMRYQDMPDAKVRPIKSKKMRYFNSTTKGGGFDYATIQAVWNKGQTVLGYDPTQVRKDSCGAWMYRREYGKTNSRFGWEIDHIKPVSQGGSDLINNLQPLQWENNRHKSDNWPNWSCRLKAA